MRMLLAVVSIATAACQSSSSGGGLSSITAQIGPEGGTLVASDGTRVLVPAGALPASVSLTLTPSPGATAPPGTELLSAVWTLEPSWLEFAEPITVTFPVDRSKLDAGPLVVTTAPSTSGYQALGAAAIDATHVAARASHFATGAAVAASCPARCVRGSDPVGETLRCAVTCLGHAYALSCSGPTASTASCTCSLDGVVTSAMRVDTDDGGAGEAIYAQQCGFPSSSWAGGM